MPFGIPSEDFHGGFGIPHDDEYDNKSIITVQTKTKEQVYEEVILGLNNLLIELDNQGCIIDEELRVWYGLIRKYEEAKGLK